MILRNFVAGLCFLAGGLCWLPASAEIRIAVAGPMGGQFGAFGEQMLAGAAQAVADLNAAGGVNGEGSFWKWSMTAASQTRPPPLPIS